MKQLIIKLGLIQSFKIKLDILHETFVERFKKKVEPGDISALYAHNDLFSSNTQPFKGKVSSKRFKIRKKRTLLSKNYVIAEGDFEAQENHLIVHLKLNAYDVTLLFFYTAAALILIVLLLAMIMEPSFFLLIAMITYGSLVFVLPVIIMRSQISDMKSTLIKEFQKIVNTSAAHNRTKI